MRIGDPPSHYVNLYGCEVVRLYDCTVIRWVCADWDSLDNTLYGCYTGAIFGHREQIETTQKDMKQQDWTKHYRFNYKRWLLKQWRRRKYSPQQITQSYPEKKVKLT